MLLLNLFMTTVRANCCNKCIYGGFRPHNKLLTLNHKQINDITNQYLYNFLRQLSVAIQLFLQVQNDVTVQIQRRRACDPKHCRETLIFMHEWVEFLPLCVDMKAATFTEFREQSLDQ